MRTFSQVAYNREWRAKNKKKFLAQQKRGNEKARFGGLKQEVLKRDNYTCRHCGMTNDEHIDRFGGELNVHHKDGKGRHSKKRNHSMDNMITLCYSCHARVHNAIRIKKDNQ